MPNFQICSLFKVKMSLHLCANNNECELQSSMRCVHLPKAQDNYELSWTQLKQCENLKMVAIWRLEFKFWGDEI